MKIFIIIVALFVIFLASISVLIFVDHSKTQYECHYDMDMEEG